ncbi:MAG: hypothetical protein KGJ89_05325 [Patescibacteria group bacterium]|nr:hypothetical protein [Patescibacteria group bacterium]MDE2015855.1 hypothetical protein [Patescibacteria group bacterium]MDE2227344.1 hypothetical protein [Patescibacteria group bacterium]
MAHAGGRPVKYKTVEELQKAIDEYFAFCDARTKKIWDDDKQKEIMVSYPAPYTMHGLARAMGIDRDTLINYSHKEEFFGAIKAARQKVAEDVETRLMDGKAQAGAIFNLKNNFGWKDEQKHDIEGGLEVVFRRGKTKD